MRKSVQTAALVIIAALLFVSLYGVGVSSSYIESDSLVTGPYVDEVIFKVIANRDIRILALQDGEIEMDSSFIDPVYYLMLTPDPDISIYEGLRNGYGQLAINCEKYPLNISGLRRAFAFAFNKTRVIEETLHGFGIEHDSLVPRPNGWCAEDQFDFHYYTAQPEIGNQILDDLNFTIDAETGFRLAPDGSPFEIIIEYSASGYTSTPQIGVDALESLHINARALAADFNEYISRINHHEDFDIVFYGVNFDSHDIDWLAYSFWSEYADVELQNPTNFRNETYDSWRDQLLYGITYEEVYEAAVEMQKILQYNVPRLVVYENTYLQAYRNDQFTGHVEDLGRYISGPWTMRKIQKLDGSFGGSISVAIGQEPDSFNFFVTNSVYSIVILSELWPSLYKYDPDLNPWPDIAKNMLTETNSDNSLVPDGHTRFTIDIIQNATWTDGTPITRLQDEGSLIYAFESEQYGNPAGTDISDLVVAYAPTTFRVIIEFSTESYWHFNNFAFDYIIPEHIFNNDTGIGYQAWNTWNPVFDPAEPNVNCGPFIYGDYEAGEYYTIERNPLFYYAADPSLLIEPTSTTTSNSNTTSLTNSTIPEMNWSLVFSSVISGISIIVIIYCLVMVIKSRQT